MNQILEVTQIIGKTISNVISGERDLYIKFSDNSFCIFENKDVTEGYGYPQHVIEIDDYPKNNTCCELVELGVISKNEYDLAIKEEEIEYEKRRLERANEEKTRQEALEYKEFIRLNAKFR